jgi:hypothetical protein
MLYILRVLVALDQDRALPSPRRAIVAPRGARGLLYDPWVPVVQADSPLARSGNPPSLREIAALPLIGYRTCASIQRIDSQFALRGYRANTVFKSDNNAAPDRRHRPASRPRAAARCRALRRAGHVRVRRAAGLVTHRGCRLTG